MLPPLNYTRYLWSFRDQKYGWTETWTIGSLSTQAQMQSILGNYLQVRMPLMAPGIWSDYASARQLNKQGLSFSYNPNIITLSGPGPVVDNSGNIIKSFAGIQAAYPVSPERPYSALMAKWIGTAGQRKVTYLSGIPNSVITDPFGPFFNAAYAAALLTWSNYIIGTPPLGWIGTTGNQQVKNPLISISAGPNATVVSNGGSYAPGSIVYVGGMRGLAGYRGYFTVLSSTGSSTVLQGYNPPAALTQPKGYIQQVVYTFIPAGKLVNYLETHRNRGKGIDLPVGRRRTR